MVVISRIMISVLSCENRQHAADTKRTHQKRHARRLATHRGRRYQPDLQEKVRRP